MATDIASDVLSGLAAQVTEAWREARAERIRRTTPIAYWCQLFENFAFSPQEFYALVTRHLEERAVPDLLTEFVLLHESTVFSRKRLYLELRRERFVFQLCAAPFGTGWFVSSRLFDRRRGARWLDYVVAGLFLACVSVGVWAAYGIFVAVAVGGAVLTFSWSLMRLAAYQSTSRLDELLCRVPCLGRVYETFFHPETYFRQDQRNMYKQAVQHALKAALRELQTQKGLKLPPETASGPELTELTRGKA